jgi:NAD(P)-dependent dehydrogenase (short-subunit alcohol dehydrogenase family)
VSIGVFDLTGQVALVTGGGTGIGRATATLLAEHGADIVVASRRVENLELTARDVEDRGRTALVRQTDVRQPDECRDLIDATVREFGKIDILVNNAGGSKVFPLDQWSLADFENAMALNLRSAFFLSQAAARNMLERKRGSIVNISSIAGHVAMPSLGPYGAAKAGVDNLTRILAAEYGPHGIRVNGVAVGFVKSEGFVRAMNAIGRDPDEVGGQSNALGRAGVPQEIAYPVLFLVSGAATFMSGETINVTGGPPVVGPW